MPLHVGGSVGSASCRPEQISISWSLSFPSAKGRVWGLCAPPPPLALVQFWMWGARSLRLPPVPCGAPGAGRLGSGECPPQAESTVAPFPLCQSVGVPHRVWPARRGGPDSRPGMVGILLGGVPSEPMLAPQWLPLVPGCCQPAASLTLPFSPLPTGASHSNSHRVRALPTDSPYPQSQLGGEDIVPILQIRKRRDRYLRRSAAPMIQCGGGRGVLIIQ